MFDPRDLGGTELHLSQALRECLEASSVASALYDGADTLVWANAAYERLFLRGLKQPVGFADVLRHGFEHGFGVNIECGDVQQFLAAVLPRRRSCAFRGFAADLISGEWLWWTETLLPSGWLLCCAAEITSLKNSEALLRRDRDAARLDAQTDALTGTANRRHVLSMAEALLGESRIARAPFCVATLDLDHFKSINDQHGHAAGDEVLKTFASFCQARLRKADLLGRTGGEEFLILMPNTGLEQARLAVERLRQALPAAMLKGQGLSYTFSAGIAEARASEELTGVLARSDAALYRAKRRGRDRSELADVAE